MICLFWTNFVNLCAEKGIAPNALAAQLGFSSGSITAWKNGTVPRETTLKKIADYFSVSVDYLIGRTNQKEKPATIGDGQSETLRNIMDMLSDLTPEKLDLARSIIASIKESK